MLDIAFWVFQPVVGDYCCCSSFLVRDELYCCIKAMALSALSFTTFIFYAAVLRSWYKGSSLHSVWSLTKKICAFIFPFNERTSKTAAVFCDTQVARPVIDNGSGGLSRRFADSADARIWRFATICLLTSAPLLSSKKDSPPRISEKYQRCRLNVSLAAFAIVLFG